jgi:uncharacterized membrane protein (UPF0127 family)
VAVLRNATTHRVVATRVRLLAGFFERAIGLLGRDALNPDEGVWIAPCTAIHTLGMRVTIDVIFVDERGRVLRLEPRVRPNRPVLRCRGARGVVELADGALLGGAVRPGDYLELD